MFSNNCDGHQVIIQCNILSLAAERLLGRDHHDFDIASACKVLESGVGVAFFLDRLVCQNKNQSHRRFELFLNSREMKPELASKVYTALRYVRAAAVRTRLHATATNLFSAREPMSHVSNISSVDSLVDSML